MINCLFVLPWKWNLYTLYSIKYAHDLLTHRGSVRHLSWSMCQQTRPSLVQIMACRCSAPNHYLNRWWFIVNKNFKKKTSVLFETKYKNFYSWKCIWKCHQIKWMSSKYQRNHNKTQQSAGHAHNSWDVLYNRYDKCSHHPICIFQWMARRPIANCNSCIIWEPSALNVLFAYMWCDKLAAFVFSRGMVTVVFYTCISRHY